MKPLHELTALEIARAVESRETSCEAVTRACLERIAEREEAVQAWQYLDPDLAIAQARELDAGARRGPIAGVPVGFKDIIDTHDMPTECGTPIHKGRRTGADAACVALTRRAGGVALGKTVTTEFANFTPGKTRHPQDASRTPGGSSSGSAAAVAAGMVPLAVGTQTTGSTIRPAAFCGCVGYRPTWGDIRLSGVMEAAGSLDTLGIIARTVDDVALYRDVLLGVPHDPFTGELGRPPRIGLCRTQYWDRCEPSSRSLLESCARKLAKAGASVTDVTLPPRFKGIADAHRAISSFEFARAHAWEIDHHWDAISERLRSGRIRDGLECSFESYREARAFAESCRLELDQVFSDYDVLLTPAAAGEAPLGLGATGDASLSLIWTTTHVPSITLPLFSGPAGLPVGAQLVARRDHDRKLLQVARWVLHTAS